MIYTYPLFLSPLLFICYLIFACINNKRQRNISPA
nr:MAG TPA: chitin synthase regulator [Caudoviricetes sp.]